MEKKKDRKFILYIVIIIFIASLGTLTYRVGSSIKAKKDAIKEEFNKEKQEIKDKQKQAEEEAKKRQEEIEKKMKEDELEREKDSFNNMHEFYAGTKGGTATGSEVDEIIKSNKKSSDHLIEVIFDGTSYGTDPDKIKEIKSMLKSFNGYKLQDYEISVDYDENGYVNKVTIESK